MGTTITTYLINSNPQGARYVQIEGEICRLYFIPRDEVLKLTNADEMLDKYCLYFLIGGKEKREGYIGQTDSFLTRVKNHLSKDFWDSALVFVSTNDFLSTNSIKLLEHLALKEATNAGCFIIHNSHDAKKKKLQEHEIAPVEKFYNLVKMLTGFVGCEIFLKKSEEGINLFLKTPKLYAKGMYDQVNKKLWVLKESVIAVDVQPSLMPSYVKKRKELIASHCVNKDDKLIVIKDIDFDSPSAASNFVLGSPSNGWNFWKNDTGKSLKEIFEK